MADELSRLAGQWVDWVECPDDARRPPSWAPGDTCWTLGEAWEKALTDPDDGAAPCVGASGCDNWAPQVAGYYQVRFEIAKPTRDEVTAVVPSGLKNWHDVWLKRRHSLDPLDPFDPNDLNDWDGLGRVGGETPPITFDDLVWVTPLSLSGLR